MQKQAVELHELLARRILRQKAAGRRGKGDAGKQVGVVKRHRGDNPVHFHQQVGLPQAVYCRIVGIAVGEYELGLGGEITPDEGRHQWSGSAIGQTDIPGISWLPKRRHLAKT